MAAAVLDGKALAAALRAEVRAEAEAFAAVTGRPPGLAVVLVGEDPASQVYVRNKLRQSGEAAIRSFEHRLSAQVSERSLLELIQRLNSDPQVDGILVQMPLPEPLAPDRVILALDPAKDVDGLHPMNAGRLVLGRAALVACTPQGCVRLIKAHRGPDLAGLDALVIGRSMLVGKPLALLLQAENCTVTMAHSRTLDLAGHARRADILVAAIGRARFVRGDWVKPGATVIDVGINRASGPGGGLVGDVAYEEALEVAGAVTPVPGGVGPMTIACLLRNTVVAALARAGLPPSERLA